MSNPLILLADEPIYRQMGAKFRDNSGVDQLWQLALFTAVLLGIVGIAWWISRTIEHRRDQEKTSPRCVFNSLCRAHQLNRHESSALWEYAISLPIEHPATVFLIERWLSEEMIKRRQPERAGLLSDLQNRLFQSAPASNPKDN